MERLLKLTLVKRRNELSSELWICRQSHFFGHERSKPQEEADREFLFLVWTRWWTFRT